MRLRSVVALFILLFGAAADAAASLAQPADHFWVVLAQQTRGDDAIAAAQLHSEEFAIVTRASEAAT